MINIVLLGAGNVASHFYKAFKKTDDITVIQWYNRNLRNLQMHKNDVSLTNDVSALVEADLYLICVSDDAIAELSKSLNFNNRLVAHTSGSVGIHDLDKKHRRAVFYPLQTFSKNAELSFKNVPICIEVIEKQDYKLLKTLAEAIESPCYKINGEQRASLHLAAVFVNNFTNQLYRIAHEITEEKSVDFNILKPLIFETAKKIETLSPYLAQTGPAKRHDKKTIKKHLKQLEREDHKAIYQLLTDSIKNTHGR